MKTIIVYNSNTASQTPARGTHNLTFEQLETDGADAANGADQSGATTVELC